MSTLEEIVTPLKTLWRFDYDTNVKALRDLYELAKKQQWNAATDIHWDLETDPSKVGTLDPEGEDPILQLDCIKALSDEQRTDLAKRRSAWQLSQFLHGEQGAMLCAGQLVETVPDIDGKYYASTQVVDEARHVEVFHKYIQRLDRVYPILPNLKALLNAVLTAELWQQKCVGMQVIAESMAMGSFKQMKKGTSDELLREIVELTAQDEARHVSYGLIYMQEELPKMAEDERNKVEDFALAGISLLAGPDQEEVLGLPLLDIMGEVGVDMDAAVAEMAEKLGTPEARAKRFNPFQEFVIPQLKRINLITERTAPGYAALGLTL